MLQITDITEGKIKLSEEKKPYWEGTGSFDKLMSAINANIQIQYDENRLVGADFASVYIKGIEMALSHATQYSMQRDITNKNLELLEKDLIRKDSEKALVDEQVIATSSDTAIKTTRAAKDLEAIDKDIEVKTQQIAESRFNIDEMLPAEKQKIEEEIDLLQTQDTALIADTTQKAEMHAELVPTAHQEYLNAVQKTRVTTYQRDNILPAEKENIIAKTSAIGQDEALTHEKELTEKFNRENILPQQLLVMEQDAAKAVHLTETARQESLAADLQKQILDVQEREAEKKLLELLPAQIDEVEAKAKMYVRQTRGFDDDRDQRLIDSAKELWTIAYSSNPTGDFLPETMSYNDFGGGMINNMFERAVDILDNDPTDNGNVTRFNETPE